MPFVTATDGVRLYYETIGQGEPLLLVAGQSCDHHWWDFVRDDLAVHYQAIVYDHRGTGQSDKPEQPPYSTRGFARDAVDLLDALGVKRTHAYGMSMGGRILQWLGIEYPGYVGALVLACTTPGNTHGVRRTERVDEIYRKSISDFAAQQTLMGLLYSPEWAAAHVDMLAESARVSAENAVPEHARRLHYQASESHDAWDLLPMISAPTLVTHGSEDIINPTANAALLAERIPNAELYIVQGGHHGFFIEFGQEVNRVILDFLARHPLND